MKWVRNLVAVAATIVLVGCVPPPVPYDKAASNVKTIGVLTPQVPNGASVLLASTPGQAFGLIGALVDAGIQANRESRFKDIMDANQFQMQALLLSSLTDRLKQHGYQTVLIPFDRPANTDGSVSGPEYPAFSTYPKSAEQPVDALLDVIVINYGYMAAGIGSSAYRPIFTAKVRLLDAKTGTVMMQDHIAYNPIVSDKNIVTLAPDATYAFADVEAMQGDPAKTVLGVKAAIEESGKAIANLLRQQ